MTFPKTERQATFMALADQLAAEFAPRAAEHDRDNTFPFENFDRLRETGYLALTVPEEFGGGGANPLEFALAQERLPGEMGRPRWPRPCISRSSGASANWAPGRRRSWTALSGHRPERGAHQRRPQRARPGQPQPRRTPQHHRHQDGEWVADFRPEELGQPCPGVVLRLRPGRRDRGRPGATPGELPGPDQQSRLPGRGDLGQPRDARHRQPRRRTDGRRGRPRCHLASGRIERSRRRPRLVRIRCACRLFGHRWAPPGMRR